MGGTGDSFSTLREAMTRPWAVRRTSSRCTYGLFASPCCSDSRTQTRRNACWMLSEYGGAEEMSWVLLGEAAADAGGEAGPSGA